MATDIESLLHSWAEAPNKADEARFQNAEGLVRAAVSAHPTLRARNINVFAQGSFKNRTNIPGESDVDICVLCHDTTFLDFDHAPGVSKESLGLADATYDYPTFRNDVHQALWDYFGQAVTRSDKCFDIRDSSVLDADVIAAFDYRFYTGRQDWLGRPAYLRGAKFISDSGKAHWNYPDQHHENGVAKNNKTGHRYKAMVRILKRIRADFAKNHWNSVPSYLLECLVYNVPDSWLNTGSYANDLRNVISHCYNSIGDHSAESWFEVNQIKFLFHQSQKWKISEASTFLLGAWKYLGFS